MTKAELVAAVAAETSEHESTVESVLDAVIAQSTQALAAGDVVELSPLGRFVTRHEAEHTGSNPQTHEPMQIPASVRVLFHVAKPLRDAVNLAGA